MGKEITPQEAYALALKNLERHKRKWEEYLEEERKSNQFLEEES